MAEFDPIEHEKMVAAKYEQLQKVDIFDRFIDFALDGVVTFEQAIQGYKETCEAEGIPLTADA